MTNFDKAYLISDDNLVLSQHDMQDKWRLYRELKKSYTFKDLYTRISRAVEKMIEQGAFSSIGCANNGNRHTIFKCITQCKRT